MGKIFLRKNLRKPHEIGTIIVFKDKSRPTGYFATHEDCAGNRRLTLEMVNAMMRHDARSAPTLQSCFSPSI